MTFDSQEREKISLMNELMKIMINCIKKLKQYFREMNNLCNAYKK